MVEQWDGVGDPNSWLNERERHWIAHYKASGNRLTNATDGGMGILGYRHTDETRRKIGEAKNFLGKSHSEETRTMIGEAARRAQVEAGFRKGKRHTDETRARLAAVQLGSKRPRQSGEAHWTARSGCAPNTGKSMRETTKVKLSESLIGRLYPNRKGQRVREINSGLEFHQASQAAQHFGISKSTVSRCVADGLERRGLRFAVI